LDTHAFGLFQSLLGEALAEQAHPDQIVERQTGDGLLKIRMEPSVSQRRLASSHRPAFSQVGPSCHDHVHAGAAMSARPLVRQDSQRIGELQRVQQQDEFRRALRALLMRPLMASSHEDFPAVRRQAARLRDWFAREVGGQLTSSATARGFSSGLRISWTRRAAYLTIPASLRPVLPRLRGAGACRSADHLA